MRTQNKISLYFASDMYVKNIYVKKKGLTM
jgi:hypothetical protein